MLVPKPGPGSACHIAGTQTQPATTGLGYSRALAQECTYAIHFPSGPDAPELRQARQSAV